jgi:hypothetical protein
METPSYPIDVERVLAANTVHEPGARALFLSSIREFGKDGPEYSLERLQRLMAVEEHFQNLLLYDQLDFLRMPFNVGEGERDFALNIQRICLEAANGLQRFLRNRAAWATTKETIDLMFRVTGLALNAIHAYMKWSYFLNDTGRSAPWKQLHALYMLAEGDSYAQVPFVLHDSQPSFKPSVQSLYLRTLILETLNTGNLSKTQIEIADGWFSSWCSDYMLDSEYSSRSHLFYVDIASESGMHLMRKDSHGESVRYVNVSGMKMQIEEVKIGLRHGRLYAGYGAGAVFPVEEHVALLAIIERLYQSILAGSDNRIEERTSFEDREVEVVLGANRVFEQFNRDPSAPAPKRRAASIQSDTIEISDAGLTLAPVAPAEAAPDDLIFGAEDEILSWRVSDMSSKGFGLLADRSLSDEVILNGLIGIRNQENPGWMLGRVVRKLPNRVKGEVLVGVEVMHFRPARITLQPLAENAPVGAPVEALFCAGDDGGGKLDAIVLRIQEFDSEHSFRLTTGGSHFRIRLNRIVAKGADWVKARFEIEAKT